MIYDISGTALVKHYCDCVFCVHDKEEVEVDVRVIADDEIQASSRALVETEDGYEWREEPTITEVKIPFNKEIPLREVAGFVTDGYIALKRELVGDVETREVKNAPDWIANAKRQVHLSYQGNTDYNAVIYISPDETEVLIDELYHEAIKGLGVSVYSQNNPVQPLNPILLVDRGEVVGFIAPMLEH